jgi:hypothetical protein
MVEQYSQYIKISIKFYGFTQKLNSFIFVNNIGACIPDSAHLSACVFLLESVAEEKFTVYQCAYQRKRRGFSILHRR